ncbi:putative dehydrogenase [Sphaerochaeta pleomorpha str. Grapes]|uniref:Putative dehydrogenase n=1 Tax=Sphaerochaeta pleomorpha (strain ATCC BAA-1885 / DSM 22778 / Grapes) TaxID=158190 RepID=G8QXM5_SPHPG|nr:Gfo/Idh/MocA family oxidoreductase [Sphaerochaeta pleomorpha]AEV29588.1 putative dehydrogenase [Sphaerochaeta pleomorpha str. Grapes]
MKRLGVAVVGCGAVARNHGKAIKASNRAHLLYCVDIDLPKAEAFSLLFGGQPTDNLDHVLQDPRVDCIHIVTPHFTHPELVIKALESGKDVLCEKPLSIHVSDANRMLAVSQATNRKLCICFQNRLNEASLMAKDLLEREAYGKIISAAALVMWHREGDYYAKSPWRGRYETEGGGCIINQSIHTLDLLQYLCGKVSSLSAVDAHLRQNTEYEVEDSIMVNFNFEAGFHAVGYFTNCAKEFKTASLEIVCEKGRMKVEQKGLEIVSDGRQEFFPSEVATGEKSEWGLSHGRLIESFYSSVLEDKPVCVDAVSARESVKIISAIKLSKGKLLQLRD